MKKKFLLFYCNIPAFCIINKKLDSHTLVIPELYESCRRQQIPCVMHQDAEEEDGVGTESDSDGHRGSSGGRGGRRRSQNVIGQSQWMRLRSRDDDDDDDDE